MGRHRRGCLIDDRPFNGSYGILGLGECSESQTQAKRRDNRIYFHMNFGIRSRDNYLATAVNVLAAYPFVATNAARCL
jgi:hypothetical protein